MRPTSIHLVFCFACFAAQQAKEPLPRVFVINEFDGGSMVTKIGDFGGVNEGSALKRRFFVVNDPMCPVQLSGLGIKSRYSTGRDYSFTLSGSATAHESISAVEIILVLFDLWGSHMHNLSSLTVKEVSSGSEILQDSEWGASTADVREFMTSVSYVKRVRTPDGKIWRADARAILEKLASVQLKISAEDLEPPSSGKK
jgi:hypothetical protein